MSKNFLLLIVAAPLGFLCAVSPALAQSKLRASTGGSGSPASASTVGKYEVLAKTLTPFIQAFSRNNKSPNHAIQLQLRLEEMTGLPPNLAGARASADLQPPENLRLRGPLFGQEITIARHGQDLWIAPQSRLAPLLEAAQSSGRLSNPDSKYKLAPLGLPFSDKQLVFFPALFQVRDLGEDQVDTITCRVLDLQLMPELTKALGLAGWNARLWISPDFQPVRLALQRKDWQARLRFESVKFLPSLPEKTWEPEDPSEAARIAPAQYQQLLKLVTGSLGKH